MLEFIGYIVGASDKAILFHDHFWDEPDWVPRSQSSIREQADTTEVIVLIRAWLPRKNGYDEFTHRAAEVEPSVEEQRHDG